MSIIKPKNPYAKSYRYRKNIAIGMVDKLILLIDDLFVFIPKQLMSLFLTKLNNDELQLFEFRLIRAKNKRRRDKENEFLKRINKEREKRKDYRN